MDQVVISQMLIALLTRVFDSYFDEQMSIIIRYRQQQKMMLTLYTAYCQHLFLVRELTQVSLSKLGFARYLLNGLCFKFCAISSGFLGHGKLRLIRLVYQVYLYGFFSIAHFTKMMLRKFEHINLIICCEIYSIAHNLLGNKDCVNEGSKISV